MAGMTMKEVLHYILCSMKRFHLMDPTEMLFREDQLLICFGLHMGYINRNIDIDVFFHWQQVEEK